MNKHKETSQNINKLNDILCIAAAIGLILGLIVHVISVLGIYIEDKVPYIWILHIGIFIVWVPAILKLRKQPVLKNPDFRTSLNPYKFFKTIFKNAPIPVMIVILIFFAYTNLNFFLFIKISGGGVPSIINGEYVLQSHGEIIKELTEPEYFKYKANLLRGFSGHWMLFYGFAMGVLWPPKKRKNNST